jgi:hypothetical protein
MKSFFNLRLTGPILAVAIAWFWSGCATTYEVKVDAISKPPETPKEIASYKIRNKNPSVGEDSLRHKEAAQYIKTALSGKGLYEAPNAQSADMIVDVDYGMEPPRVKFEKVSVPIYAQVGGGVRYMQVPVTDSKGNTSYRSVAVYEPPRTELIGYEEVPRPVVVYEKYLRVSARENRQAREGRPPTEIWSVHVSAEDESKDLRKYIPVMAAATIDHIGTNTKADKTITVSEKDSVVDFVKKGM